MSEERLRWEEQYRAGCRPWDSGITPPEVKAFWASGRLPLTGLALDLGCGPGTNVAYLARLGLTAVGVELAGHALATAALRHAAQPSLAGAYLVQADVSSLPFRHVGAAYVLDIGCLHGLPPERRPRYAAGVAANLEPGGYYHLFAFDRIGGEGPRAWRGMAEGEVAALFAPVLEVVEVVQGRPDRAPCRWYLLRKQE